MKLSTYMGQIGQNYEQAAVTENSAALEQGLKNGMNAVLGKLPGQAVSGEVLLRNGSDILIAIGKNQLLQAKLEGNMQVQLGQLMTFQIKNNTNSKIVLTPLFENTGMDPNVSKALQAAGLPENSITAGMVKAMMQEGLPIDRQSLYQMNRLIANNPQADIQTLVQMHRLSLPVTPENIFQFEAYKNYQHQLGESLMDLADAFTQSLAQITGSGNWQEGAAFYKEIIGILSDTPQEAVFQNQDGSVQLKGEMAEAIKNGEIPENTAKEIPLPKEGQPVLPREERNNLALQLKGAGVPEEFTKALAEGKMGGREILKEIGKMLSEETIPHREELFKALEGREFKSLLKNEMGKQWMLLPEEVAKEHSVDKLYERLNSQMNRLSQALAQSGRGDTPLAKTVSNVGNNIDFMNQLNQMFTYVQLPLKMQGKNANGELFVYTNKKSLAKKDGSVSALLHLDMESLGSLDVHVSLTNQKVSTKFYLQDDSALDLIAQNIGMLNDRLEKRGYSMNAEFIQRDEHTTMMDEILKQGKNISALTGYSFDARA